MKTLGILLLIGGLVGIAYGLSIKTGGKLKSHDLGYGLVTPEIEVHDKARQDEKRNTLLLSGVIAIAGAILLRRETRR